MLNYQNLNIYKIAGLDDLNLRKLLISKWYLLCKYILVVSQ
jgi:hypothetical protein